MALTKLPKVPETPLVDAKGNITPAWRQFFIQLLAQLKTIP